MTRAAVERRLRGLHRWRTPGHTNGPASPRATWWENGHRAATYAALLAAPASALMTWRTWIENGSWEQTSWGAADTALTLLLWELGWIGAGFMLGALWRLLPGRRRPARAWASGWRTPCPSDSTRWHASPPTKVMERPRWTCPSPC